MFIDGVFKTLDPVLRARLAQTDRDPLAYYEKLNSAEGVDHIWRDLRSIDAKSSGLLTHISVMFVVLGFLASNVDNFLLRLLLTAEFLAYICLLYTSPSPRDS